ncbi:hypothetical protein LZ32DRAFT_242790 [Colletotrichum eremochloae]|nr:hypothetical protein LZ32DRAFT_242790 [Colletotrichum eremochloae]
MRGWKGWFHNLASEENTDAAQAAVPRCGSRQPLHPQIEPTSLGRGRNETSAAGLSCPVGPHLSCTQTEGGGGSRRFFFPASNHAYASRRAAQQRAITVPSRNTEPVPNFPPHVSCQSTVMGCSSSSANKTPVRTCPLIVGNRVSHSLPRRHRKAERLFRSIQS